MKHAITQLQNEFDRSLDEFCINTENGNTNRASRASLLADDYMQAIKVLMVFQGLKNTVGQEEQGREMAY